jgi:nicotinate phosphoribosyltransferase
MRYSALLTDLYELTMLAGYHEQGMTERKAVFDLFFRPHPFNGSYAVFAGLEPVLAFLEQLHFLPEELDYLASLNQFKPQFLDYLRQFRFHGTVTAPPEGTVVFAGEPLLTIEGSLAEAQFVETAVLNIINFQTLIATKAARITHAAAGAEVIEFGLRRAHGPDGGLSCARAACVGGICSTSNVQAGMRYALPVRGTHAHSWVQAFPDELSAFRAYAETFPDNTILLVDTYDTLKSGIPNAIIVARELRERGYELRGIRLDSGDLVLLSRESRRMLDAAGFTQVRIVASNDLDEYQINAMKAAGGQVDIYGIGTQLATAGGSGGGALGGVYKLVELEGLPKLKLTSDLAKATLPGRKRVLRSFAPDGRMLQDLICMEQEQQPVAGTAVYNLCNPLSPTPLPLNTTLHDLRQVVMRDGCQTVAPEPLSVMAERSHQQLSVLPQGCLRIHSPERYTVSISEPLYELNNRLTAKVTGERPLP